MEILKTSFRIRKSSQISVIDFMSSPSPSFSETTAICLMCCKAMTKYQSTDWSTLIMGFIKAKHLANKMRPKTNETLEAVA